MRPAACRCVAASGNAGFSLLELLVVIALLAAVTAVAMPGLTRFNSAIESRVTLQSITNQLVSLPRDALDARRDLVLLGSGGSYFEDAERRSGYELAQLDVPEGWRVEVPVPVRYRSGGICLGGQVRLFEDGNLRSDLVLRPPRCIPAPATADVP